MPSCLCVAKRSTEEVFDFLQLGSPFIFVAFSISIINYNPVDCQINLKVIFNWINNSTIYSIKHLFTDNLLIKKLSCQLDEE